jgi:hypothetical protein
VHDWLPTFLDAAGALAPARIDGVSLIPSLTVKGKQRSSTVYIEYFQNQATPNFKEFDSQHRSRKRNQMQMIRFGDTVGVRYDIKTHNDNFEIYNVIKDPQETINLANNSGINWLQNKMKDRVLQVRVSDTSAPRPYDNELVPPVAISKQAQGVEWKFYNTSAPWIPDVTSLSPVSKGIVKAPATGIVNKDGIVLFTGFLEVPTDGDYTFSLIADAGAFLRIHDAIVIDEDFGYKGGEERSGILKLKAGLHPFRLYYKAVKGQQQLLDFKWQGPGISKQPVGLNNLKHS